MTAFRRIAVVNRGEPARRLMHAVRELNHAHDTGLKAIALYTAPDANARFVQEADESFYLGPAMAVDSHSGQRRSTYLNHERLAEALRATSAEAAWVGWGFVAEDAEFADLCRDLGVVFIGPSGACMRRLGDKIEAKRLAEQASVPVAPWSGNPVVSAEEAAEIAAQLGYPVVLKARNGGGGRGIRKVASAGEIAESFVRARSEAMLAFGDDAVFIEKMVDSARHIEVQVIADHHGNCWALGARDCSVQRRHQKVIEEAPPPNISDELLQELGTAAERLVKAAGYHNAGTMECLLDTATNRFCFMEMNTRLQVEHPVTEITTGVDLVKLQLHVASGGHLEGTPPLANGHAIEVRLNAEDPDANFAPAPGLVQRLRLPTGPGVRVDTGISEGDAIPPDFDSMIAKIIAHGRDRAEASARLQRALAELLVTLDGGTTNRAFLLEVLRREEFVSAKVDIGWLDRSMHRDPLLRPHAEKALIWAAIETYQTEHAAERAQFLASAARGRPRYRKHPGLPIKVRHEGQSYELTVYRRGPAEYGLMVDGQQVIVTTRRLGDYEGWLYTAQGRHHIVSQPRGLEYIVDVDGVRHRISRDEGGVIRAPSPGLVVSVIAQPGQEVKAGDPVVVLEAMKMESAVGSPAAGRVRAVLVEPNAQVDAATPLVVIEPAEMSEGSSATGKRAAFAELATVDLPRTERQPLQESAKSPGSIAAQYDNVVTGIRRLSMGFELFPGEEQNLALRLAALRDQTDDATAQEGENKLLELFVDTIQLYSDPQGQWQGRSSGADYLQAFVRALASQGESLTEDTRHRLERMLAHYGVSEVAPSADVEDALLWNYKALQRAEQATPAIETILTRRLGSVLDSETALGTQFARLIERLIDGTHHRFLKLHDLARQIHYRGLHRPQLEARRNGVYRELCRIMESVGEGNESSISRDDCVRHLVDSQQQMAGFLSRWLYGKDETLQRIALESLVRRYYRVGDFEGPAITAIDHLTFITSRFSFAGSRRAVVSFACSADELQQAFNSAATVCTDLPHSSILSVDVFVRCSRGKMPSPEKLEDLSCSQIFEGRTGRVCYCLLDPAKERCLDYLTFSIKGGEAKELIHYRSIHPMSAGRLELWRMRNFEVHRIPAPQDIYLYHAVAHGNPKDERLFAYIDVRDCAPIRDNDGAVVQMTGLEWMFLECMDGLRDAQLARGARQRLQWNRVLLYFWGPLPVTVDELTQVIQRLAPATANLGLERVTCRVAVPRPGSDELIEQMFHFVLAEGKVVNIRGGQTHDQPIRALSPYYQKVLWARRRGLTYPYEIISIITPSGEGTAAVFPRGRFLEYDLGEAGTLEPVFRPMGENTANVVVGVIENTTRKFLEGMKRVIVLGDASMEMGALAAPECRRIIAAIDLAESMGVPLEWFPLSAGAKISMQSGTENLDWTARVLRRLVEFTQGGGEVNIIVAGVNVGAQSYWNAEATMLMHTRGILIMTAAGSMVLTGKRALDSSGGVSAEDNQGIGGAHRIMGPNGEAQYMVRDLTDACHLLFRHYDLTYVAPGERFPRPCSTSDPAERDVTTFPLSGEQACGFQTVGEIFAAETNPARKKPFDIRGVMTAVADQDSDHLERWAPMRNAEMAVVWDTHLGGMPVCMLGIESRPLERRGFVPGDGPESWTGGTLFPLSSKKVARAINAASGNRPVVVLANLSGFDGSPESLRRLQLEYGAEIGRAVVNFVGPMVFCVISRYHGGAYVVFSRSLNPHLTVAALEGSYASVIGGAPAAAVVLAREVKARAASDPRLNEHYKDGTPASTGANGGRQQTRSALYRAVHLEKQTEIASEFDGIHDVHRAKAVGSLDSVLPAAQLRPFLIGAVNDGMRQCLSAARPE